MFSNELIRKHATTSDENNLRLSKDDWTKITNANSAFTELPSAWRGSSHWGHYLLNKICNDKTYMNNSCSMELCCGTGYLFFSLRKLCDIKKACYVDISHSQLAAFMKRCHLNGIVQPDIRHCDIGSLPFQDNTFNLLFGNSFLHHLPDVGFYLSEFCRVLSSSGVFISFHEPTLTSFFWERFPMSLVKKRNGGSLTDIWIIKPSIITKLLHEAGFASVNIYPGRLISSLFVEPVFHVLRRMNLLHYTGIEAQLMQWCDSMERLALPYHFRIKYCPSIAIVAKK